MMSFVLTGQYDNRNAAAWIGAVALLLVHALPVNSVNAEGTVRPPRASSQPASAIHDPVAAGDLPQYIFFNLAPTTRVGWRQDRPETFSVESFQQINETLGTRGSDKLRVGVSYPFSILETKPPQLARSLRQMLKSARATDTPVLITLDGQNWWEKRPDLWNWWDPGLAGYDPGNRFNVEWTGWGPEHAVKIGWRNWGSQIRVRPAPNLSSPRFLAEHWKAYDALVPILVRWQRSLPADKRYLFGGLKLGWEASINVNAYYHEDGNRIFERSPDDPSGDPKEHDPRKGWTFGLPALGYAAVSTAKVKVSGTLTKEDIETVVHRYLEALSREAHRRGMPVDMIFTHQGGTYAPWDKHLSFKPAINAYSIPGYSFYSHDPADCGSLAADLTAAGREQWAASEWWRGAADKAGWIASFEATLGFRKCRFVCVYNWGSFIQQPGALAAVREIALAARN
jgi:hypothetical protein